MVVVRVGIVVVGVRVVIGVPLIGIGWVVSVSPGRFYGHFRIQF